MTRRLLEMLTAKERSWYNEQRQRYTSLGTIIYDYRTGRYGDQPKRLADKIEQRAFVRAGMDWKPCDVWRVAPIPAHPWEAGHRIRQVERACVPRHRLEDY